MEKYLFWHLQLEKMMCRLLIYVFILLNPISGFSQRSVTGCYSSNFAIIGWFAMHLKLNPDHTFDYHFYGDLISDHMSGTYQTRGHFIFLTFKTDVISREITLKDSLGNETKSILRLKINGSSSRPSKLKYAGRRLYIYNQEGIRQRYKNNRFDHKKRYFLKQHPEHGKID